MIQDLEVELGLTADVVTPGEGGVQVQNNGTFKAWACCEAGFGLIGSGPTERAAVKALEAKMKAMGYILATGHAQAAAHSDLQRVQEDKRMAEDLMSLLGGGSSSSRIDSMLAGGKPKKPDGEGGN